MSDICQMSSLSVIPKMASNTVKVKTKLQKGQNQKVISLICVAITKLYSEKSQNLPHHVIFGIQKKLLPLIMTFNRAKHRHYYSLIIISNEYF